VISSGTLRIFVAVAVLACLPAGAGAGPTAGEYEGVGEVPVVGGNQVSARRRALELARRDAVGQAVVALLPEGKAEALGDQIRSEIHARAGVYVRTYRVLEERQAARRFRVKVAARLDISRLQDDLNRLVGIKPGEGGAGEAGQPPRLVVSFERSFPAAGRAPARAALISALARHDLRLSSGKAAESDAAGEAGVALVATLATPESKQIRGTAWPARRVTLTLRLLQGATEVTRSSAAAWGAAPTIDAALARALKPCLKKGLAALLKHDRARAMLAMRRTGWLEVRVVGVNSARQLRRLRAEVCRRWAGRGGCRLTGAGNGAANFSIRTRRAAASVGKSMEGRALGDNFILKVMRVEGGQLWLTVQEQAPPAAEDQPAAPDAG